MTDIHTSGYIAKTEIRFDPNGVEQKMIFGWSNVPYPAEEILAKTASAAGSAEAELEGLNVAWREQSSGEDPFDYSSITATFDKYVVVSCWEDGGSCYYRVDYTGDGEDAMFDLGSARELQLTYVAKLLEKAAYVAPKGKKKPVKGKGKAKVGDVADTAEKNMGAMLSKRAPKVDLQGDMIELSDLEDAAYQFVLKSRLADADHSRIAGQLVESFMATDEKYRAMGIPEDIIPSLAKGWWCGFVVDDEAWAGVKDGTYRAFSIFGKATSEPVDE